MWLNRFHNVQFFKLLRGTTTRAVKLLHIPKGLLLDFIIMTC